MKKLIITTACIRFNSIKVRLRPWQIGFDATLQQRFNSIKVRLRQRQRWLYSASSWFQFHKGTIKTGDIGLKLSVALFQFHKGTIKT